MSAATITAVFLRAGHGGVSPAGWFIAAVFLAVFTGWTANCVAAARLARSLTPAPLPEDVNLWLLTGRLLAALLIPFAATHP